MTTRQNLCFPVYILVSALMVGESFAISSGPARARDVAFRNGEVTLSGRLYLPDGAGPHPAVVLVHGSEAATKQKYGKYRKHFVNNGIVVLAYDKRGCGDSTGNYLAADFETLAADALAGIALLTSQEEVDRAKVGVCGLSQGGWVALIVDAMSSDVAFIVSVSGPGVTPGEQAVHHVRNMLNAQGYDPKTVDTICGLHQKLLAYLSDREGQEELEGEIEAALQDENVARAVADGWLTTWIEWVQRGEDLPPLDRLDVNPWVRNFRFDPIPYLEKTQTPALILYGERDDLVPIAESTARIERALAKGGSRSRVIVYPKADHALHITRRPRVLFAPVFPDRFLETIVDWIVN